MFDIPAKYEREKVFGDYMSLPMFHSGGKMSQELNFFTPENYPEISPDDYKTNAELLNEHFEKFIEDNYPEEESAVVVKKYEDGDYIEYIPGDKSGSKRGDLVAEKYCISNNRLEIGNRMGNCLGSKLMFHHCDEEKIYVYFSSNGAPIIMMNITNNTLYEIEGNNKNPGYVEKLHAERVKEFVFENSKVMGIEKSSDIINFFEDAELFDSGGDVHNHYFVKNIESLVSNYTEMDSEKYIDEIIDIFKQHCNSNSSNPITEPLKFNSSEVFNQERFDSIYNNLEEQTSVSFNSSVGHLLILSKSFLLNPSRDNFLKIKKYLNARTFISFKGTNFRQYKSMSWLLKMIFLTVEHEYEKLESCIKKYKEICESDHSSLENINFRLFVENDDKYNEKENNYLELVFENYRFQISCMFPDVSSDEFKPYEHKCYGLKLSIIPNSFRAKKMF